MVVTISRPKICEAIRAGDSAEEMAAVTRLTATAKALIERYAPDAPTAICNEACIRVVGYLYDMLTAPSGTAYANALRNSGAASLLLPWRAHRVGSTAGTP